MASDLVCIEIEDEDAEKAEAAYDAEEDDEGDWQPSDKIVCQMCLRVKQKHDPQRSQLVRIGAFSVTLSSSSNDQRQDPIALGDGIAREADLEFAHVKSTSDRARLPIVSVHSLEVKKSGQLVVVKLLSQLDARKLLVHSELEAAKQSDGFLTDFVLVLPTSCCQAMFKTLRSWLPHAAVTSEKGSRVQSALWAGQKGAAATLRLDGIELTARDIMKLGDQCCLNDSCLDFFLRLTIEVVAPPVLRDKIYVASSFFFQKLTSCGARTGEEGWKNVSRWTKSLPGGIVGQRYVMVPINVKNAHWWLAILCNPGQALDRVLGNPPARTLGESSRIVCLDSAVEPLGINHEETLGFLRGYIWREFRQHIDEQGRLDADLGKFQSNVLLKAVVADVPKQGNLYDCGVFIIEFLVHILTSNSALAGLGLAPHGHWFNQTHVSHRRQRLRWIAAMLQLEAKKRSCKEVTALLQDDDLKEALRQAFLERPKKSQLQSSAKRRARDGTMSSGKRSRFEE